MTTALAPAPPITSAVPATMRQLETELNATFFERREAIRTILITLLAKQHGFILGPPGTAKSALLEAICRSIVGGKYWRILLDTQMGKEEVFGQIDQGEFLRSSQWGRDVTDTFADCHVALLDEIGNTGPSVINPMLTALEERRFKPNGHWINLPLLSAFGASNFMLDERMIAAWDRFMVRFSVDGIAEDANFMALLRQSSGQLPRASSISTTIALADLQHAIDVEVPAVLMTEGVLDSMRQLRSDLRAEQVRPSDRRWAKSVDLLKASAYLDGRSSVDEDDMQILRDVLWDVPEQYTLVERKVLATTSPMTRIAMDIAAQLDEITAELEARKGKSVAERAAYGGTAQYEAGEISKKLEQAFAQATAAGRNTSRLETVREQLFRTRVDIYVEAMNTPRERAERMVAQS